MSLVAKHKFGMTIRTIQNLSSITDILQLILLKFSGHVLKNTPDSMFPNIKTINHFGPQCWHFLFFNQISWALAHSQT